jgi:transposase
MMEKLPRQVYTAEFRHQAVEMVTREGLGIAEASRTLSLSPKTLTDRVRRAQDGGLPAAAPVPRREVTGRENAEPRMKRDILKKASAYFAGESPRGTR